jgi:hypothetical protein
MKTGSNYIMYKKFVFKDAVNNNQSATSKYILTRTLSKSEFFNNPFYYFNVQTST